MKKNQSKNNTKRIIVWRWTLFLSILVYFASKLFKLSDYILIAVALIFVIITIIVCLFELIDFLKYVRKKWKEERK